MYFILTGQVFLCSKTGNFRYLYLGPGSFFGETFMIDNKPSSYTYMFDDDEPVETMMISRKEFLKALRDFPISAEVLR